MRAYRWKSAWIPLVAISLLMVLLFVQCEGYSRKSRYLIAHYVKLGAVYSEVHLFVGSEEVMISRAPQGDGLLVNLAMHGLMYNKWNHEESYNQLAERYEKSKKVYCYKPSDNRSIYDHLKGIDLIAETDYDDGHPAGSSLNDIAMLYYESYEPFLTRMLNSKSSSDISCTDLEAELIHFPLTKFEEMVLPRCVFHSHREEGYISDIYTFASIILRDKPKCAGAKIKAIVTVEGDKTREAILELPVEQ